MASIAVTGVPAASGPVAERKEIRELAKDPETFELFLLGLRKYQQQDSTQPTSYWSIAGIHGLPFQPWNGVDRAVMGKRATPQSRKGGYCAHSSNLFATWHRPYLAFFEQELYKHVQSEAKRLNTPRLVEKARSFRLPYWDWGLKPATRADSFPNLFFDGKIKIKIDPGLEIDNPLASFSIDPRGSVAKIPGGRAANSVRGYTGLKTFRCPPRDGREISQNIVVQGALSNLIQPEQVNMLLLSNLGFNTFSTDVFQPRQPMRNYTSLEILHNSIHGNVGLNGHMNFPECAAFDPIFWLHHCNIDRLTAIYQELFPGSYVEKWNAEADAVNSFTTDKGDLQDSSTRLFPFWDNTGRDFWTSKGIQDTEKLGYLYPETKGRKTSGYKDWLKGQISNVLYPLPAGLDAILRTAAPSSLRRTQALEVPMAMMAAEPEPSLVPDNPEHAGASLDTSNTITTESIPAEEAAAALAETEISETTPQATPATVTLWSANIRTQKHALGQPYHIYVFLGDFPSDSHQWPLNPSTVGSVFVFGQSQDTECDKCADDMRDGLVVTGTVALTAALMAKLEAESQTGERLASMSREDVREYLKRHLHWRVGLADGTEVPRQEVAGLVVCVSAVNVTIGEDGVPVYDLEHDLFRDITDGRPAGLGEGDEL